MLIFKHLELNLLIVVLINFFNVLKNVFVAVDGCNFDHTENVVQHLHHVATGHLHVDHFLQMARHVLSRLVHFG